MNTHVYASDGSAPSRLQVVAAPVLRVRSGASASVNLGDRDNGFAFTLTPSEIDGGAFRVRGVFTTRVGGASSSATLDVLLPAGQASPAILLRDRSGAVIVDDRGRPIAFDVEVTRVTR